VPLEGGSGRVDTRRLGGPPYRPAARPCAPVLTATRSSRRGVQLNRTVPASHGSAISTDRIYRGAVSGSEVVLVQRSSGSMSYRDTTSASGTLYFYRLTAVNGIGEGTFSNEASARAR
jgi:hypothetical protein